MIVEWKTSNFASTFGFGGRGRDRGLWNIEHGRPGTLLEHIVERMSDH